MTHSDTSTSEFKSKVAADDPTYKKKVAEPTMSAIDSMPKEWRELVYEYGYVDIYRAWKRGILPKKVIEIAEANNGIFKL